MVYSFGRDLMDDGGAVPKDRNLGRDAPMLLYDVDRHPLARNALGIGGNLRARWTQWTVKTAR